MKKGRNIFKQERSLTPEQKLVEQSRIYFLSSFGPMLSAAIASFVTTYYGVLSITDWLAGASDMLAYVALLVSFVGAGVSLSLWGMTIRYMQLYVTGTAIGIGASVLVYLVVMTSVASTFTSFIGLTEQSARALYLMDQAARYAAYVRDIGGRALDMKDTVAFITPEAKDACAKSEVERTRGLISGSAGTGPIASKLQTLCIRKKELADTLTASLQEARPLIDRAKTLSRNMDLLILDKSRTLTDRELDFIRTARELEAVLDALRATNRMRGVRYAYQTLGQAVEDIEVLKASVSRGQANALTEIIASERSSAATMAEMLNRIEAVRLPEAVRAELIPAPVIAVRYAWAHIPQLGLAISLDAFGPLSALLFFAASLRRSRQSAKS